MISGIGSSGGGYYTPALRLNTNKLISRASNTDANSKIQKISSQPAEIEMPLQTEQQAPVKREPLKPSLGDLLPSSETYERPLGLFQETSSDNSEVSEEQQAQQSGTPEASSEESKETAEDKPALSNEPKALDGSELSQEEQQRVQELKARDTEVQTHEMAHIAASGGYSNGGPQYSYEKGPDGQRYRTGGHVSIDTGKEDTPEQTIAKAQVVKRAALAPAQPSSQDRSVAAQASRMEAEARQEMAKQASSNIEKPESGIQLESPASEDSSSDKQVQDITPEAPEAKPQETPEIPEIDYSKGSERLTQSLSSPNFTMQKAGNAYQNVMSMTNMSFTSGNLSIAV